MAQVTVYEARPFSIVRSTKHWTIDEDLVDFPVVSQLNVMTIRWKVDGISSGRLTFVVRSSKSVFLLFSVNSVTYCTFALQLFHLKLQKLVIYHKIG